MRDIADLGRTPGPARPMEISVSRIAAGRRGRSCTSLLLASPSIVPIHTPSRVNAADEPATFEDTSPFQEQTERKSI
jgi:hypothetical protein